MRRKQKTDEEKVAEKMAVVLSDVRLDLDEVGIAIARMRPSTIYNRLIMVTDSAEEEMENQSGRRNNL